MSLQARGTYHSRMPEPECSLTLSRLDPFPRPRLWARSDLTRHCLGLVPWALVLSGGAIAQTPSIAERDWRPREVLSEAEATGVAPYCDGTYVAPPFDWTDALPGEDQESQPVQGRAQRLESDRDRYIRMMGGVELRQGRWRLDAESAELDRTTNRVQVPDGVVMRSEGLALEGDQAEMDLGARTFRIDEASFLIYSRHARGEAGTIRSESDSRLFIDEAVYTTCSPSSEAWVMTASSMVLDRENGEGVAKDLVPWIAGVPVAYFPYLAFPIDDRRRSGFLYPSLTNSNVGRGIDINVPYYFNLHPSYDATYTPRYIHGRGLLSEVEGRHLSRSSRSTGRLGYIAQDAEYEKSGGRDAARWALDFQNTLQPFDGWYSAMDINAVSDKDYLRDLNRTLEINEETHIRRTWDVSYAGDLNFNSRVLAYQTIDKDIAEADRPYLLLPQLDLSWSQVFSGVTVDLESEYTYFWRDNENLTGDDRVIGSRLRWQPALSLPLTATWGYLTPRLRLDHTDYVLQDRQPEGSEHQGRTVPFGSLDGGLFFDRQTQLFGRRYSQSLEPRLFYVHSPVTFQDDLPNFDSSVATFSYSRLFKEDRFVGGDRVGDNNRLTLGLTTRLNDLAQGSEVLRASIGQIIYFRDQVVDLEGQGGDDLSESPFAGEFLWRPNERVDVKVDGQWNGDTRRTDRGATTVSFHDPGYDTLLNVSHRYGRDDLEQTELSGLYTVTPSVVVLGRWLFDLVEHRTIGALAGIEYNSCCWRVQLLARDALVDEEGDQAKLDRGYFLRFELRGLGSLSNQLEEVLNKELRNFAERDEFRKQRYNW